MSGVRADLAAMLSDGIYEITLLDPDDLTADEHAPIPAWWFDAIAQPNPAAALGGALDQWDTVLPGRLPKFLAYTREHGQGLFLGRQILGRGPNTQVVLVYALTDSTGDTPFHCWVGSPPAPIPHCLQQLPTQVKAFHTHLHDAFRWAVKVYLGILPITELDPLSDYIGPGDLQLVNTDTEPDYTRIIAIYSYSTPRSAPNSPTIPTAPPAGTGPAARSNRLTTSGTTSKSSSSLPPPANEPRVPGSKSVGPHTDRHDRHRWDVNQPHIIRKSCRMAPPTRWRTSPTSTAAYHAAGMTPR